MPCRTSRQKWTSARAHQTDIYKETSTKPTSILLASRMARLYLPIMTTYKKKWHDKNNYFDENNSPRSEASAPLCWPASGNNSGGNGCLSQRTHREELVLLWDSDHLNVRLVLCTYRFAFCACSIAKSRLLSCSLACLRWGWECPRVGWLLGRCRCRRWLHA